MKVIKENKNYVKKTQLKTQINLLTKNQRHYKKRKSYRCKQYRCKSLTKY